MTTNHRHIVCLSGGKDSSVLALELRDREPRDYTYVCTPTGDELPEMEAHWQRLEDMLGQEIVRVALPGGLRGLVQIKRALPNFRQRWCTDYLKIRTFTAWLREHVPATVYVGLRFDEELRIGVNYAEMVRGVVVCYPFREWGWGLRDVRSSLARRGVEIPARTDCARCFYQRIGEWYRLWLDHPAVFADAESDEAFTGHTFRSPSRDTWPAALKDLRAEFESGRIPKSEWKTASSSGQCRVCSL